MGLALQLSVGSVPVIGALYGAENVWVGWITHAFHSVVFGLTAVRCRVISISWRS